MAHNNPYGSPTHLDFLLMVREDVKCFDAIIERRRSVQVRSAAFLMQQQAVEKLHWHTMGNQQDTCIHDIGTLIDYCQHICEMNRIDLPSEIVGNADEIS